MSNLIKEFEHDLLEDEDEFLDANPLHIYGKDANLEDAIESDICTIDCGEEDDDDNWEELNYEVTAIATEFGFSLLDNKSMDECHLIEILTAPGGRLSGVDMYSPTLRSLEPFDDNNEGASINLCPI